MNLIDHTGHIYTLPSFTSYPTGYEYETFKYVHWIEDDYVRKLSVNEWYMRSVMLMLDKSVENVSVYIDSSVYRLISGTYIQDKIKESGFDIELDESDEIFKKSLTKEDMITIEDDNNVLYIFYVAGYATEPATWTSNILIEATYADSKEYCPITIGGVFYDESEELVINGKNMGISLPKEIIKAVYPCIAGTSIYSSDTNEALYNEKVREFLMNYMRLHGECGNFEQMKSALKFFGWGSKLTLTQLIRTDNEIITQYIKDFFDNNNDILWRMEHFHPSALVSLTVAENSNTGDIENQNYSNDFWGELTPVMEDLFNKVDSEEYDNTGIKFYKSYYNWVKTEMMLKLACLKYYYKKYFLPLHVMILSASVQHHVYANNIKYYGDGYVYITEMPELFEGNRNNITIEFPKENTLYAYTQKHYVDSNFNEFDNYESEGDSLEDVNIFYIDDVCVNVPIKFISNDGMNFFKCHLIVERLNGPVVFESDFSFSQSVNNYKSLVIYPKIINDMRTMNYWDKKHYCIHLNVNDIWYDWEFVIDVPEMQLIFGKLHYRYNDKLFRQINKMTDTNIDFQTFMYLPSLVDVNNIRFPEEVVEFGHDGVMQKFVSQYRESPSIIYGNELADRYYNRIHYCKLLDSNGNEIPYVKGEDATNADVIRLYKKFFDYNGNTQVNIPTTDGLDYDIYLMHDSVHYEDYINILTEDEFEKYAKKWYVVFISKQTIDNAYEGSDMVCPDVRQIGDYYLQHVNSDNKFLINRMTYVAANGVNHFNTDDIIVGTVQNVDLPFILEHGAKWYISPYSNTMQKDSTVTSTTNTFLMSIGGDNTAYDRGYYNITVRYSLDGTIQSQRTHKARLLVK